ncbi:hypothetical protein ABT086_35680, partial [Streptomyces mirabilis]
QFLVEAGGDVPGPEAVQLPLCGDDAGSRRAGVTTVIPGARSLEQAHANAVAAKLSALPTETLDAIEELYDRRIKEQVEGRW